MARSLTVLHATDSAPCSSPCRPAPGTRRPPTSSACSTTTGRSCGCSACAARYGSSRESSCPSCRRRARGRSPRGNGDGWSRRSRRAASRHGPPRGWRVPSEPPSPPSRLVARRRHASSCRTSRSWASSSRWAPAGGRSSRAQARALQQLSMEGQVVRGARAAASTGGFPSPPGSAPRSTFLSRSVRVRSCSGVAGTVRPGHRDRHPLVDRLDGKGGASRHRRRLA